MSAGIIPSAPGWYLSSVLAYNNGLLAYGSKNDINLLRFNEGKYELSVILQAHNERVNCLVFSPDSETYKNSIASCGDDGCVRVWNVTTRELQFIHSEHQEGVKITGLDWSVADPNLIVCTKNTQTKDAGGIACWDLPSNKIRFLSTGLKVPPTCLACCPHDKNIIAVGAKTGFIAIINIKGDGRTLFRVKGHEGDVVSLSWCPVPNNIFSQESEKNENNRTLLLASGGIDKCIYIWKAGVDMNYIKKLNLFNQPVTHSSWKKPAVESNSVNFVCVRWVDPYQILSSSLHGELLSWTINKTESNKKSHKSDAKKTETNLIQSKVLHSVHSKCIFSIACEITSERNIKSNEDNRIVWTTAIDRHLTSCKIGNGQIVTNLPSIGSVVYCIAVSPIDPYSLAIGTGDGRIFIWDMSTKVQFENIYIHWRKISGKVMALAWHPTNEDILAFATADGRIGLFTVETDKYPVIFRLYHHGPVYTLVWAPPLVSSATTKETKLALFSVGDRKMMQFCMETPDREPASLSTMLNAADVAAGMKVTSRTDFAFKPNFSMFAVANENGSLHILSCKDQTRLHTLYPHKKAPYALLWHPLSDLKTNYNNWLASGAENIKVYNIPDDKDSPVETIANLTFHTEKITALDWNPYFNGQLLSCSYDNNVQIWDVSTQTPLVLFKQHLSAVLCGIFSPLDPDLVISGSFDNTLRVWHISKQTSESILNRKQMMSIIMKQRQTVPSATGIKFHDSMSCGYSENVSLSENTSRQGNKGFEEFKQREKARSFFPVSSMMLQNPNHLDVMYKRVVQSNQETSHNNEKEEEFTGKSSAYLDYFGDRKAMKRLLANEDCHLRENEKYFHSHTLALWRGDIMEMFEEAIQKKQLSEWLLSIAPMGSYEMWVKMCSAYVIQLTECKEYVKAANYLLALNKVEAAIMLLVDNNLYKEALAIAKIRYPEDDPTITLIMNKWGQHSNNNGQLQLGAHCFIATGEYLAASDILARCNDLKSLKFSALLSENAGSLERAETLMKECLLLGLLHANYKIVEEIITEKPDYDAWSLWLEASRAVSCMKTNKKNCEEHLLSWLKQECTTENMLIKMKPICERAGKNCSKICNNVVKLNTPTNDKELWHAISGYIALMCSTYYDTSEPNKSMLRYFVSALASAYHYQATRDIDTPLLQLCYFFSPQGPFSSSSIFMYVCESEDEKLMMKSARAFLCAGIVHWLINSNSVKEIIFNNFAHDEENGNAATSETHKETNARQLDWLVEVIEKCQEDVLDPKSFLFFKIKSQKQLLLDSMMQDKVQEKKVVTKSSTKKLKNKKLKTDKSKAKELNDKKDDNKSVIQKCGDETSDIVIKKDKIDDSKLDDNEPSSIEKNSNAKSQAKELNDKKDDNNKSVIQKCGDEASDIVIKKDEIDDSKLDDCKPSLIEKNSNAFSKLGEGLKPSSSLAEESCLSDGISKKDDQVEPQRKISVATETNGLNNIILVKENGFNDNIDSAKCLEPKPIKVCDGNTAANVERIVSEDDDDDIMISGSNETVLKPNVQTINKSESKQNGEDIEKIDIFLNQFQECRIFAPNPFVACSNIKLTINNYIQFFDTDLAEELTNKCDILWEMCSDINL